MVRSRFRGILFTLTFLASTVAASTDSAWATDCGDEKQIYVDSYSSATSGSANDIYIRDASLDQSCTNPWSVRTSHVRSPSGAVRAAEAGWWEDFNGSGVKEWSLFTAGYGGAAACGERTYFRLENDPDPLIGHTDRFKVNNIDGSDDWNFWVDWDSDGGYVQLLTGPSQSDYGCPDLLFTTGTARGEISVRGSSGAADHQSNLRKKICNPSCAWSDWQSTQSDGGNIPGWYPDCSGSNEFYVRQTNANNC